MESFNDELMAGALREVKRSYRHYNHFLFSELLTVPVFQWSDKKNEWGAWLKGERVIRLSPSLLGLGWGSLTEVLKHEMAHQYVDEVEMPGEHEGAHGATFRQVCADRAIDARAAGDPESVQRGPRLEVEQNSDQGGSRRGILSRIEKLLALAQSDNRHEAEVAMTTARKLMLKYNLEEQAQAQGPGDYHFRQLGVATGRRMAWQRVLATILNSFFFVEIIIVPAYRPKVEKSGSILEASGTNTNLDIAAYAYDFLESTAFSLWEKHKKEQSLRLNREKQSFLYGVMKGFYSKLEAEAEKNCEEGLVWVGDPLLDEYHRRRNPRVQFVRSQSRLPDAAYSAGHDAGQQIVFHKGVQSGNSASEPRRLGASSSFEKAN